MRIVWIAVILVATLELAGAAQCQCGEVPDLCKCVDPPILSIKSNTIFVSGQTVHQLGKLPSKDERWFYSVTCHTSSRLFNFSLWTIAKFHDRDGFYFAKSWSLQILDTKGNPDREVTFDRENEFYFWGDAVRAAEGERIRIDSIVGLPLGLHGEVILRKVPQK